MAQPKLVAITEVKIEKAVPMPAPRRKSKHYPFDALAVGDSFLVPGVQSSAQFSGSVQQAQRRTGFKFTTRREEGGIRVWRTA